MAQPDARDLTIFRPFMSLTFLDKNLQNQNIIFVIGNLNNWTSQIITSGDLLNFLNLLTFQRLKEDWRSLMMNARRTFFA